MIPPSRSLSGLLLALFVSLPFSAYADDVGGGEPATVGHVTNLAGTAVAERPGEEPRLLHCRDAVYEGEKIVTSENSHVGVLTGDVYALVGQRSAVGVNRTPAETTDLLLEKGAVRVIDPRADGSDARLRVLDAHARVLGNDAEAYVFAEKAGPYAMLCEWDDPLAVARGGESSVADAGRCVVAKKREPLYQADAHPDRLGSPGDDRCAPKIVWGGPLVHLDPTDVASAPFEEPWSGPSAGLPLPSRSPCDVPGSGCGRITLPPPSGGGIFPTAPATP